MIISQTNTDRFKKVLSIALIISLVLNQAFAPAAIYAGEIENEVSENNNSIISPIPDDHDGSASSESSADNNNSEAYMQTGNATSTAETEVDVNRTESGTEGEITTDGCNPDGSIDCDVITKNNATIDNGTNSDSNSGENTIDGYNDASLNTGAAAAQSTTKHTVNTNIITANSPTPTATPTATLMPTPTVELMKMTIEIATPSPTFTPVNLVTPTPEKNMSYIEIQNKGELKAQTTADGNSGGNTIEDAENADTDTGDAYAAANQVNVLNTNIAGTDFEVFILDLITNTEGDIDLNLLWNQLLVHSNYDSAQLNEDGNLNIFLDNEADLDVLAEANAVSGDNTSKATETSNITTGDAYAAANIFNLVNTNIIGSQFFIGIINIFSSFTGNIILPNPEKFLTEEGMTNPDGSQSKPSIKNGVEITDSTIEANAVSGENTEIGSDSVSTETGDALASAQSVNVFNLNLILSNWYLAFLNNFGFWDGEIVSWESPTAVSPQVDGSQEFTNLVTEEGAGEETEENNQDTSNNTGESNTDINNQAKLTTTAKAIARSGGNHSEAADSRIQTGRSVALANVINFVNTNIIGGKIFLPIINIFDSWTGNLVFAYPDLTVSIIPDKEDVQLGDVISYNVSYENLGYEATEDAKVTITLPEGESFVSSSGPEPFINGQDCTFNLGEIAAKAGDAFSITTRVHSKPVEEASLMQKIVGIIVPAAHAESESVATTTQANINSPSSESNNDNNSSSATKYVMSNNNADISESESRTDDVTEEIEEAAGDLKLFIKSENNAVNAINPGDAITFTAHIHNTGDNIAKEVVVFQDIVNSYEELVITNTFEIGDIEPGLQKKISFTVQTPYSSPSGDYISFMYSSALQNGKEIYSNDSSSFFTIAGGLGLVPEAYADEGDVQGESDAKSEDYVLSENTEACENKRDWLPYILAAALTFLWFVEYRRRRSFEKELEEALDKLKNSKK